MLDGRSIPVGLVGAGRLAASLGAGLARAGYRVRLVAAAHEASARSLAAGIGPGVEATTDLGQVAATCDLVFLAIPDAAVAPVSRSIAWEPRHLVVHCSGALGLDALAAADEAGATTGCFHPLQTFPSRTPEPDRFGGIFCGVEALAPLGAVLEQMARDLGSRPIRLEGVDRALYHAAAVVASNHLVALTAAATRLWALAGLPGEAGREALSPLIVATARNVSRMELADALTGPVARGDVATVEAHLRALRRDPSLLQLYQRLTQELLRLPLALPQEVLARLREALKPAGTPPP